MSNKEPVRLRRRVLPSGNTSLYLDVYMKGRRKLEFLRLYLVPEKTRSDKEKNRETIQLANAIKAKRIVEIQNNRFDFENPKEDNVKLFPYFENIAKSKSPIWACVLSALKNYEKRDLWMKDITTEWANGFIDFLGKTENKYGGKYQHNSKVAYATILKAFLRIAFNEGVLKEDIAKSILVLKAKEVEKSYLTLEELKAMSITECENKGLKRAFLFSCLTGLRKSDILKMTWGEVQSHGDFTRIVFRQKKTSSQEYLDISPQAVKYMGERRGNNDRVFHDFSYTGYALLIWAKSAGIDKHITFHTARHTFAVLMLELDVDIYTVQKLLGHRDITTTQIYAKVVDKKKQEAVSRIPELLKNEK